MSDSPVWKVVAHIDSRAKTVFEGLEEDARAFVVSHFPRLHAEPGAEPVAAASLVSPDGQQEVYHGPESGGGFKPKEETQ